MSAAQSQLALDVALRDFPDLTTMVAGPNGQAITAACHLLDQPGQMLIWGAPATGKSTLLQALARYATEKQQAAAYLSLSRGPVPSAALLAGLETLQLVCLDDISDVAGEREEEIRLVELINRVRAGGGALLMSSRRPPARFEPVTPDLQSRLGWGLVYELAPLDDEDKAKLLRRRAAARGLTLSEEAARYLMRRRSRDLHGLMTALERLDSASLAAKRRLTIPFIREVLGGD